MVHDRPNPHDIPPSGQVLKFRLPGRLGRRPPLRAVRQAGSDEAEPTDHLAKYEQEDINVDDRRRMLMNVIAVAVVALLVELGVWIADTIADMEKAQDCAMQGRQNCAPIEAPRER